MRGRDCSRIHFFNFLLLLCDSREALFQDVNVQSSSYCLLYASFIALSASKEGIVCGLVMYSWAWHYAIDGM